MKIFSYLFAALLTFASPALAQMPGMNAVAVASSIPATCTFGGNDSFTKVLLHMDGANGAQTFIDNNAGGVQNRTWTPGSTANNSTTTFKFGTASALFSATGFNQTNRIVTATSSDLYPAGGAFSIDAWVNKNGGSGAGTIASLGDATTAGNGSVWFLQSDSGNHLKLTVRFNSLVFPGTLTSTATIPTTGWHHVYGAWSAGNYYVAIDGVLQSSFNSGVPATANGPMVIGQIYSSDGGGTYIGDPWIGYIDEVRYRVGIVNWTSNFSPPTLPWCN